MKQFDEAEEPLVEVTKEEFRALQYKQVDHNVDSQPAGHVFMISLTPDGMAFLRQFRDSDQPGRMSRSWEEHLKKD